MIVTDVEGDLFADLQRGDVIAHGANCRGQMGAGVAKIIRNLYPDNYTAYKDICKQNLLLPGGYFVYRENGHLVFNLATQYELGADARIDNIVGSLETMANDFPELTHVKTVRLGCGIGGLAWEDVKPAIEAIDSDIEIIAYYI